MISFQFADHANPLLDMSNAFVINAIKKYDPYMTIATYSGVLGIQDFKS